MTTDEAAWFIINRWRLGHHPKYIMVAMVMLGFRVTTQQVMHAIRIYCDHQTENKAPQSGVIPNP
jgi:hypothetical protein